MNKRDRWKIGASVEIYSISKNEWFQGKIDGIFYDDRGEWLRVQYIAYNIKIHKHIYKDIMHMFDQLGV